MNYYRDFIINVLVIQSKMPKWDDVVDPIFDVVFHNEANCGKKSAIFAKTAEKNPHFQMLWMKYILLKPDK